MNTVFAFAALVLAALVPLDTVAQSSKEIISSDAILKGSLQNIMHMDRAELESFNRYLAQCFDELSLDNMIVHECSAAQQLYETEFDSQRDLDRLIGSLWVLSELLRRDTANRYPDLLTRFADVKSKLRNMANLRFAILRHGG